MKTTDDRPMGFITLPGSEPMKFTPFSEPIIEAFKEKWIREFGLLNDDNERNGYFFLGFLSSLLNDMNK